ncbi:acetyltransferase [Vibrio sp. UCD-FRSSP16_10]|uniref:GNAT family N-acetyltransferase n=1 Tax=unclassified Vibrio TaxID=2614977 RepID=UPI0007FEE03B|nr:MULTISPECIES: GNAT family N-acetyltransferase [unclassified Vibrio]OBT12108.1 acetyltransferase [Vibrio sp. UCD-FRSSP16_30]OBT20439.1 acetyltransferase [Vibrio sp. UCD-FRSSP16_10]
MSVEIIPIQPQFDLVIKKIIKSVGAEFGAVGEGYGPSDPEVENMSAYYTMQNQSRYFIAIKDGVVIGGCGVAPFTKGSATCELKKLFLLEDARGLGLGVKLTEQCLSFAQQQGFSHCYLDTLSNMTSAIKLYEKLGFSHLSEPLEGTVHNMCDVWMLKTL